MAHPIGLGLWPGASQAALLAGTVSFALSGVTPDNQTWTVGSAVNFDASVGFTGSGLTYSLSPRSQRLPYGLSLNSSTGAITGTPTVSEFKRLIIRATDGETTLDCPAFMVLAKASATADHVVSTDAEWDTAIGALVAGDIIEIASSNTLTEGWSNRTPLTGTFASPVIVRSEDVDAYIPGIEIDTCSGFKFEGLAVRYRAWPYPAGNQDLLHFGGANADWTMWGCWLSHGFGRADYQPVIDNGGEVVPFDTVDPTESPLVLLQTQQKEWERQDNVIASTSSSVATALSYKDTHANARGMAWVRVYNRNATDTIRVKLGESGVTAGFADNNSYEVGPGGDIRIGLSNVLTEGGAQEDWRNSSDVVQTFEDGFPTHVAIIADGSEGGDVNVRTEIGLAFYLGKAMGVEGGSNPVGQDVRHCLVEDLFEGLLHNMTGEVLFFDNRFERCYRDAITGGLASGEAGSDAGFRLIRNEIIECWSAGPTTDGVTTGDSADPHADPVQIYTLSGSTGTILGGLIAGNRYAHGRCRAGSLAQALFVGAMGGAKPDTWTYVANTMESPSANASLKAGKNLYSYGNTFVDPSANDVLATDAQSPINDDTSYRAKNVAAFFTNNNAGKTTLPDGTLITNNTDDGNVVVETQAQKDANFSGFANDDDPPETIDDLIAFYTAVASSDVDNAGAGAVGAIEDAVMDYTTSDPDAAVDLDTTPIAIAPLDIGGVASGATASASTSTTRRKLMGGPLSKTITPEAGTSFSVEDDDGTVLQALTSSAQTLNARDKYLILNKTASATAGAGVTANVDVDGATVSATIVTDPGAETFTSVNFDDAADVLTSTGEWYSGADFSKITIGMRGGTYSPNGMYLFRLGTSSGTFILRYLDPLGIIFQAQNSANETVVSVQLTSNPTGTETIMISVDLTEGAVKCRAYVGDTNVTPAAPTLTEGETIDASRGAGQTMKVMQSGTGDVEFLFIEPGEYIDLDDPLNRALFHSSNIGADGSGVFGSAPHTFLTGSVADWNAGTDAEQGASSNSWTMTGAVV